MTGPVTPPEPLSFTCPRCGAVSHNPNDVREGYCGRCHWWTDDTHLAVWRPCSRHTGITRRRGHMTTLTDALTVAIAGAQRVKESRAHKSDPELPAALLAYRGDDLVAYVYPETQSRDAMLACAQVAAAGFAPDVLALAFETTGKEWGPGELQEVALHHGGRAKGRVTDAVMVAVCNRAGDRAGHLMPYRIAAKTAVWLEAPDPDPTSYSGYVFRALSQIMTAATVSQIMGRQGLSGSDFGLDAEESLAHLDCATAMVFAGQLPGAPRAAVALTAERGSRRESVIRSSLPNVRIVRP